jgi:hypothetical protein
MIFSENKYLYFPLLKYQNCDSTLIINGYVLEQCGLLITHLTQNLIKNHRHAALGVDNFLSSAWAAF